MITHSKNKVNDFLGENIAFSKILYRISGQQGRAKRKPYRKQSSFYRSKKIKTAGAGMR